jgi:hypothetical protein
MLNLKAGAILIAPMGAGARYITILPEGNGYRKSPAA